MSTDDEFARGLTATLERLTPEPPTEFPGLRADAAATPPRRRLRPRVLMSAVGGLAAAAVITGVVIGVGSGTSSGPETIRLSGYTVALPAGYRATDTIPSTGCTGADQPEASARYVRAPGTRCPLVLLGITRFRPRGLSQATVVSFTPRNEKAVARTGVVHALRYFVNAAGTEVYLPVTLSNGSAAYLEISSTDPHGLPSFRIRALARGVDVRPVTIPVSVVIGSGHPS